MLRYPLKLTLFPYTTLFRSIILFDGVILGEAVPAVNLNSQGSHALRHLGSEQLGHGSFLHKIHACVLHAGRVIKDRKSTRLNSSHTVISYAVFCLKKKMTRS